MIAEDLLTQSVPQEGLPGAGRRIRLYSTIEREAVGWLSRHLHFFDPLAVAEEERKAAQKALVELSLLLACRVRIDPEPLSAEYEALLDHVERVAARASYRDLPARDHGALLLYGLTYAALRVCGRDDARFRTILERTMAARYPLIRERIPFRQLDLIYLMDLAGFSRGSLPGLDQIFPQTLLAGDPSLVQMNDVDSYAVTHALFYVTDFGLRAPQWPAGFDPAEAARLVEALLVRFRTQEHTDLAGELAASLVCLGVRRSPEIDRAWLDLRRRQEPDGRIPGPAGVIDEARAEELGGAAYRDWKVSYHTTMVAAIAAVMCRRAEEGGGYPAAGSVQRRVPENRRSRQAAEIRRSLARAAGWLAPRAETPDLPRAFRAATGLSLIRDAIGPRPPIPAALGRLAERLGVTKVELLAVVRQAGCGGGGAGEAGSALPVEARAREGEGIASFAVRLLQETGGDPARLGGSVAARRKVREQLTGELLKACRDYRLDEAALVLRAVRLLGGADRIVRDVTDYLLSQQTPEGGFGYLARDEDDEACEAARLNVTLAVVWALSEVPTAAAFSRSSASRRGTS